MMVLKAARTQVQRAVMRLVFDGLSTFPVLDPRITHTRASTGTYTDSDGVQKISAYNLLTFSQEFDNAAWTKSIVTVTANAGTAPDGSTTADRFTADASLNFHSLTIAVTGTVTAVHTLSFYLKADGISGANIRLRDNAATSNYVAGTFDLGTVTAVAANVGNGSGAAASITAVGSGWFRCAVSGIANTSGTTFNIIVNLQNPPGTNAYTGDGTSGIYIWGAQLETGSVATPYIPTFAATSGAPRIDYDPATLAVRGLLIEEQRTNLVLNSATLSTQSVTVAATAHTLRFTGTGTVTLSGTSTAGPLVGTGANDRVSLTFTPTAGSLTLTVTGSVTLAQLEAGAFGTSYIPTVGSQVTRSADVATMTGTNFSSWYNQTEGTFVVDWIAQNTEVNTRWIVGANDGTTSNIVLLGRSSSGFPSSEVILAGVSQCAISTTPTAYTSGRTALGYKADSFAMAFNGTLTGTDAAGTPPTVDRLNIGDRPTSARSLNGWIKSITYYNTRLPDSTVQGLSAL